MRQWKQHKQPWVVEEHQMQPLHSLCTGAGSGTMPLCPLRHAGAGAAPIQFVPARVMGEQRAEAAGRAAGVLRQDWTALKQAGVPVPPPKSRAYWHQNYGQWSVSNEHCSATGQHAHSKACLRHGGQRAKSRICQPAIPFHRWKNHRIRYQKKNGKLLIRPK